MLRALCPENVEVCATGLESGSVCPGRCGHVDVVQGVAKNSPNHKFLCHIHLHENLSEETVKRQS